jgi:hypothetical protein
MNVRGQGRAALHKEMLSRIADLEDLMAELGHARPPITKKDFLSIKKAIAILKGQPVQDIPVGDYGRVVGTETILKEIAAKSAGKQALPLWLAILYIDLTRLAQSVSDWRAGY